MSGVATVLVVDPEGRLQSVAEALRRGGIENVRVVEQVPVADTDPIDCVLVAHHDDDAVGLDGVETMATVREHLGSIPLGVYTLEQDRETLFSLLEAGADTVICVPPGRATVLATRVRHLAGVAETESLETQYRSLLGSYPQAVYVKDRVGRFVNVTDFAFDGFDDPRIDREHALGLTDYELYHRELADVLFEEEQEVLAREGTIEDKIEHYVEDGEDRWVSTTKVPRYDSDGELLGLVGDVRDVTDIKQQERMMATLHEASRRLVRTETKQEVGRLAVEIATDIDALPWARVDLFDPVTGALETVASVEDDLRWDERSFRETVASRTPRYRTSTGEFVEIDVTDHDDRELELPEGIEAVAGLRIPLGEHGVLGVEAGDQPLAPFTIELAHVLASNVGAALDRAEQEHQLTAQSERLEEFTRLGSHELRNRLQIALGAAERARADEDLAAVDDVVETLGRMNRLVSQLLALARTGTITRASESIALSGIARRAWSAVDADTATLSIDDDAIVTADRDGLLEVLEMLFRTAVDRGDSDTVRVGTHDDGFFVEDDGEAILPDQRASLFEPTHSDVDLGSGDSIYLVSVIADAHEWDVEVTTGEDGGTRFVFHGVEVAHVA